MIKPGFLCLSGALLSASALAENTSPLELETIEVQDTLIDETQSAATRDLRRRAGNETLGGYLDALPNVDSASYGEGVGRPVVRGMSGYRVKILQNDNEVSDLSAMSHDHAVAVAPRTSERIELLKGPASLLYAAQAGGVIRISDTLDAPFPEPGLSGELAADGRADPQSHSLDARLALANERWALRLGGLRQQADPYQAGNGDRIKDSDVQTDQGQISLGWRPNTRSEWQLNATRLEKDYGIPNATDEATRINMEREDIGAKLRYLPAAEWLDLITVDILHSDYLHDETEGGRKDGLFGQKQQRASLNLAWATADWLGETRLSLANSELRVCHEHGACEDFTDATSTGNPLGESVLQYWQNTGLPYSHGHPMPDTESRYLQVSTSAEATLQAGPDFSLGLHWEQRRLSADPDNIQEQWVHPAELDPNYYNNRDDHAASVSAGLSGPASGKRPGWQASVSYIERLPSVDELYWNGFHHATDSYIFGNSDLDKERSVNLDLDLQWELTRQRVLLSAFYYRFEDYIYQNPAYAADGSALSDPFHLSDVWFTQQTAANFSGGALRYENSRLNLRDTPLTLWGQIDLLDARRRHGGSLPRTAPTSSEIGLRFEPGDWSASASFKHVSSARKLADNESQTDGYDWLSLHLERRWQKAGHELQVWLKGENLQDSLAYNHLSPLKTTAPLPGRQVSLGVNWVF